jgi:hypothetical protein
VRLRVLGAVVSLLAGGALVHAEATSAAVPSGGRVTITAPGRVLDTRVVPAYKTTGPYGLPTLGLVYIVDPVAAGSATIYPCAGSPGPDPSILFDGGELVYAKFASSTPQCIVSSVPADFVVDQFGSVTADPGPTGLQYVPLGAPVVIDEQPVVGPTELHFDLGEVPSAAQAGVLLLEALNPTAAGYAIAHSCATPRPVAGDMAWTSHRTAGVSYPLLQPGSSQMCAFVYGETTFRVTLLGFLENDGPDPTRLPPTLNYPIQAVPPPGLRAVTPTRLLDTRRTTDLTGGAKLVPGQAVELSLAAFAGESATAAALNVTVTEPDGPGFLTVYPCDQRLPKASNLNYVADETVPNLVNVKLSVTSSVCFYSSQYTHLVVDLMGTFERGGGAGAQSVTPVRLLDTRKPTGVPVAAKLGAGDTLVLQIAGRGGLPQTGVAAATLNVTVTEPDLDGFVTAYPCDRDRPTASNLNFVTGQTVPNLVTARLSASGTLCLFTSATTHLVADIAAWYSVDSAQGYHELPPARILDTREPIGVPAKLKVAGDSVLSLQVSGAGGVPAQGALAVTLNVTVTDPDLDGFLTVYPCDADRPEASNLNFTKGETVPNLVTVKLSSSGTVCFYAQRTTNLVADVAGYFTDVPEALRAPAVTPQT